MNYIDIKDLKISRKRQKDFFTMKIKHYPVVSSNIASAGYDPNSGIMEISFVGGGTYQYEDVPKEVYEAFWEAGSPGKFAQKAITKSFKFKKIK